MEGYVVGLVKKDYYAMLIQLHHTSFGTCMQDPPEVHFMLKSIFMDISFYKKKLIKTVQPV